MKDQNQNIGDNSNAIQVAGDLIYSATPFTEIQAIFTTLFELNFPKIQDIAREIAELRVRDSLNELKRVLEQQQAQIDIIKLQEPFVQYEMQAMIIDIARRGEKSNIDLLWESLCTMLTKDSPELLDLLAHQARKVIPLLTPKHIAHLGLQSLFYDFESNMIVENNTELELANIHFETIVQEVIEANDVKYNDVSYLNSLGALVSFGIRRENQVPNILSSMAIFQNQPLGEVKKVCTELKLDHIIKFLELCEKNYLGSYTHTSAGKFIGWLSLRKIAQVNWKSLGN